MKIENPLLTGTDLESLQYQASLLKGLGSQLATESASTSDKQKAMNPFLGYVSRVKNFAVDKLALIPSLKSLAYKPAYPVLDRLNTINYGTVRSLVIPSIPDTNAKVRNYLDYLDGLSKIVNSTLNDTIPGCKQYFSTLLEDVTVLGSASQSAAIDRLSNNKFALEGLNKRFPGIIKRNDSNVARATLGSQYDSIKDFIGCQEYLTNISGYSSGLKVDVASKQVNELNEIISRIIMKVKQKKDVELDAATVSAISAYLYELAEEIALISAFVIHLQMAVKVLEEQLEELGDYTRA